GAPRLNSGVVYDCAAQVNDIFGEAAASPASASEGAASGNEPVDGGQSSATSQAQEPQRDSSSASASAADSATVQGSSVENTNPFPEQLTETLRAANAPPNSTASTETNQSSTQTANAGHYTGIRLNGVPFDPMADPNTGALQIGAGNV